MSICLQVPWPARRWYPLMCGIAGWIAARGSAPPAGTLGSMLASIAHRGPDGQGRFCDRTDSGYEVLLGHRRLAIIDPDGASQPMRDSSAGLALVYNGEIYNFRTLRRTLARAGYCFDRDSDTEVLLRAYQHWGYDVVQHLRGMFAFAIWDARRESLFLARDRFGEKPLYIRQRGDNLYFASEIKALLCVPGLRHLVDLDAVGAYLAFRYVPAPLTLFDGIEKLMPGTIAIWKKGRLEHKRYWSAPDREYRSGVTTSVDPAGDFLSRLSESVRLQTICDVPFGAFLSGGIDSSIIVALMRRHHSTVKTFSVGFRDDSYSELPHAAEVARHVGAQHHEIVISDADLMERLPGLVAMRDAPVSEPSDIPIYMLACEASRCVKMVLTGEGSDELLGGYPKHVAERIAPGFQRLPDTLRRHLIEPLVHALPYRYRRIKTAVKCLNTTDPRHRFIRWFGALDSSERERLSNFHSPDRKPRNEPPFDSDPRASPLRQILYFDQTSWLPDNLLERTDRMTMAASVEARAPYLDHKLAEFVSTLPDSYRVRGLRGKRILRDAGAKLLPRRMLERPKVGFRVPVHEWFRGPMRDYLLDHLQGSSSLTRHYFAAPVLDRMIDEHMRGRQNHEKLLWTLLNLEVWHRQYAHATEPAHMAEAVTRAA